MDELQGVVELVTAAEGRLVRAHVRLLWAGLPDLAARAMDAATEASVLRRKVQRELVRVTDSFSTEV
jgi:hypothetical protein